MPQAIGHALHQLKCIEVKQTLDLGCGTGLSGIVLRELSGYLTGVDISAKMLAQAKNKGIYDELIEAEIIAFLQQNTHAYDLIVAADVLPYLGELKSLFTGVHTCLNQGGLFVFSHEISANQDWQLQNSARFCHHPDYIKSLCAEQPFEIIYEQQIVGRQQEQQGLHLMLYVVSLTKKE